MYHFFQTFDMPN